MVIYLGDIVVFGDNPNRFWAEIVTVIQRLIESEFMLNMKKSDFLEKEIKMLSF